MGGALVSGLGQLWRSDPAEFRRLVARELDVHGGSPAAAARSLDVPLPTLQRLITAAGLRGEAKRARDRWARRFRLGDNDPGG